MGTKGMAEGERLDTRRGPGFDEGSRTAGPMKAVRDKPSVTTGPRGLLGDGRGWGRRRWCGRADGNRCSHRWQAGGYVRRG